MEQVKSIGLWLMDVLGLSTVALALIHFTLDDVKSVILLIGSTVFLGYKIYDLYLNSISKKLDHKMKQLEILEAEEKRKGAIPLHGNSDKVIITKTNKK